MSHAVSASGSRHPLRVNLVELLRQPGARRDVDTTICIDDLAAHPAMADHLGGEPSADRVRVVADIAVTGTVESGTDDVVVTLTACTQWDALCRRCLSPVQSTTTSAFREYYAIDGTRSRSDDEVIAVTDDRVDLEPVVVEYVALDLPVSPVCRADCPGLCVECGAELATMSCECDTEVIDERWAALDGLREALSSTDDAGPADEPGAAADSSR